MGHRLAQFRLEQTLLFYLTCLHVFPLFVTSIVGLTYPFNTLTSHCLFSNFRSLLVHRDFLASETRRQCYSELAHFKEQLFQLLPSLLLPHEGQPHWKSTGAHANKLLYWGSFQATAEYHRGAGQLLVPRTGGGAL